MSDAVAVTANTFVALNETAPSVRPANRGAGEEPKTAFEDVPALAKIREEQRADKKRADEASGEDGVAQSTSDTAVQPPAAKASKHSSHNAEEHAGDEVKGRPARSQVRPEGHETKADATAALAGELTQVVSAVAKGVRQAGTVVTSDQGRITTEKGVTNSQKPAVTQAVPKNGLAHRTSEETDAKVAVTDAKAGVETSKKVVTVPEARAGVTTEKEQQTSTSAGKVSPGVAETATAKSQSVAPKQTAVHTEHAESKAGAEKTVNVAQAAEAKVSAKSPVVSAEKPLEKNVAKVGAESGAVAEAAEKLERSGGASRQEGHGKDLREATGVHPGKEAQVAAVSGPGKDGQLAGAKEGMKEQADVSISTGNDSATSAPRLSSQSPDTSTFNATALRGEARSVSDQILDSVRASLATGERQVMVRLNPPELGSVTVRFQEQGEQIRAVLEVARSETRHEVERAIPEVLRTLQDAGVNIRRVEVVLADQSGKDMGKEQLQQDAWAQQQNPQQHSGNPRASSSMGWESLGRTVLGNSERAGEGSQNLSTSSGINMLA